MSCEHLELLPQLINVLITQHSSNILLECITKIVTYIITQPYINNHTCTQEHYKTTYNHLHGNIG